jgi:uncharacterized protein (DUF488 family)
VASALLFTVGHGTRSSEAFIRLLHEAQVSTLIDIRRFPGSRRHPQFGRDALAAALREGRIRYEWQGEALGGRRSGRPGSRHTALRNRSFSGYADHMDSPAFRTAVDALIVRAGVERLSLMCAETLWWRCHRMLVADALVMRGATVIHLLDVGEWQPHRLSATVRQSDDGWPLYDRQQTIPGL